jgi:hypothetical protein
MGGASARRSQNRTKRVLVVNALALLVAVPALAYSFSLGEPGGLAQNTQRLVADAAVSMSASVPANPYNTLAAQLSDEQAKLDARASQLSAEQISLNSQSAIIQDLGLAGFGLSVFLLILVGLNFYFDVRRRSGAPQGALARKFLVDLR